MESDENSGGITLEDLAKAINQIGQVVMSHNSFINEAMNDTKIKNEMRKAYGGADDSIKQNFAPAVDYLLNKNREYYKERGGNDDDADAQFDKEFKQVALQALEQGKNPLDAVMFAARGYGFQPQEAKQVATEATKDAVEEKQAQVEGGGDPAAAGAEQAAPAEAALPPDVTGEPEQPAEPTGKAIEAAASAERPNTSGVSVNKGYDDYTNEEIDELARTNPAKYAALISSK